MPAEPPAILRHNVPVIVDEEDLFPGALLPCQTVDSLFLALVKIKSVKIKKILFRLVGNCNIKSTLRRLWQPDGQ